VAQALGERQKKKGIVGDFGIGRRLREPVV